MKITIRTKKGTEVIDDNFGIDTKGFAYNSLVLYFDEWVNSDPEQLEMYYTGMEEFNGGTYGDARGAIEEMYWSLFEYCAEKKLTSITTREYWKMDFEGLCQL